MKKKSLSVIVGLLLIAFSSSVQAHSVWINSFESFAHTPPHTMVSLGWGHALPMDDFELIDPDLKKTDLIKPEFKLSKPDLSTDNFDLFAADLAAQKVALKKDSARGVYQFSAVSKPTIKKVLMAVKYQAFAKSYLTVGKWTNPKPLGHGLEIIPRTDLSNLHVGDIVEVDVLFYGNPLDANPKSVECITAHSSSFGQSDGFDGPLKDLYGKTEQVYHGASLTFNVK
jgi:uncharacterized GH25 family protein